MRSGDSTRRVIFERAQALSAAELRWASDSYLKRQGRSVLGNSEDGLLVPTELVVLEESNRPQIGLLVSLPQDFEIYQPLMNLGIRERTDFSLVLLVAEKIANRYSAEELREYSKGVRILILPDLARDAIRVIRAVLGISCIVSASESSVATHAYAHEIFLGLPKPIVKITLQHGWECLGFNQHYEQLESFRGNVSSAADLICTWGASGAQEVSFLNSRAGVVATGVCKMTFEAGIWSEQPSVLRAHGKPIVLIADNRNSPRFTGTTEMRHWNVLIDEVSSDSRLICTRRDHQRQSSSGLAKSTSESLRGASYVISPPSTVLIDALSEGCLPIAFSTGGIPDDLRNFGPIRSVGTFKEFLSLIMNLDHEAYYGQLCHWLFEHIYTIRGAGRLQGLFGHLSRTEFDF